MSTSVAFFATLIAGLSIAITNLLAGQWFYAGAAAAIAVTLIVLQTALRVRIRTGVWCGSRTPRSLERLEAILRDEPREVVVVGGGWSFYLQRSGPSTPIMFTHGVAGKLSGDVENNRWAAGTTIRSVQSALVAMGKTLPTFPSVPSATLGGWVFSGSHGSDGTLSVPPFTRVRVYDTRSKTSLDVRPGEVFHSEVSVAEQRRYVVLDVEIVPVDNVWTRRVVYKVRSEDDVLWFLRQPSLLRMLQVGRRGTLALVWEPSTTPPAEDSRTFGDAPLALWWQADVLSLRQTSNALDSDWFDWPMAPRDELSNVYGTLANANDFTPLPPLALAPIAFAYTNFEVFVRIPLLSARTLLRLCNEMSLLFEERVRARCEVRYSVSGMLFLDFGCASAGLDVRPVFELLQSVFGPVRVALHKGKMQVNTAPLSTTTQRAAGAVRTRVAGAY